MSAGLVDVNGRVFLLLSDTERAVLEERGTRQIVEIDGSPCVEMKAAPALRMFASDDYDAIGLETRR